MKNLLLAVLALIVTFTPVEAQSVFVRGGVNFATMGGADASEAFARRGANFAVGYVMPMGGVQLDLGLGFSSKGAKFPTTLGDVEFMLKYIEVPLLVRLGGSAIHADVGPTIGIKSGCAVGVLDITADCDAFDGGVDFSGVDLGLTGGVGTDFQAGSMIVGLQALYTLGLNSADGTGVEDFKNRAFTIRLGVGFPMN